MVGELDGVASTAGEADGSTVAAVPDVSLVTGAGDGVAGIAPAGAPGLPNSSLPDGATGAEACRPGVITQLRMICRQTSVDATAAQPSSLSNSTYANRSRVVGSRKMEYEETP